MSVWLAHAAKSVQTSMVPTSATAGRATTSGRTGTPVMVGNTLLHTTNTRFVPSLVLETVTSQLHTISFCLVDQTLTNVPRASAICVPTSVRTFPAVTSALVRNMDTPCLQTDALAEVNPSCEICTFFTAGVLHVVLL